MNTRPKYHAIIARQIGSDLLLTHTDVYTGAEYQARSEMPDVVWAKCIVSSTGEIVAEYSPKELGRIKNPA